MGEKLATMLKKSRQIFCRELILALGDTAPVPLNCPNS